MGILDPGELLAAATIDDAAELVNRLLTEPDPEILADLLEHVVDQSDRAHAVLALLVLTARGAPVSETGVELVNQAGQVVGQLILPPS